MNAKKLATALRLAAEALEEKDATGVPVPDESGPIEMSEVDRKRARKMAERLGLK